MGEAGRTVGGRRVGHSLNAGVLLGHQENAVVLLDESRHGWKSGSVNAVRAVDSEGDMPQRGTTEYEEVISFRLPKDEAERLRQIARADDRTVGALSRKLIRTGLQQLTSQQQAGAITCP